MLKFRPMLVDAELVARSFFTNWRKSTARKRARAVSVVRVARKLGIALHTWEQLNVSRLFKATRSHMDLTFRRDLFTSDTSYIYIYR